MDLKDILEIVVIPSTLALIALFWPAIQSWSRRRAFRALILRELAEISPQHPEEIRRGWWEHQERKFIHPKVFADVKEHRDFILSLEPDLVYTVTQLWQSLKDEDWVQWHYYLGRLSKPKYDKRKQIAKARKRWEKLYQEYQRRA